MTKETGNTSRTNRTGLAALLTHSLPGVRVRGRCALEGRSLNDPLVQADRALVPKVAPVRDILAAQYPDGTWMHHGLGISPVYRATVWQLLFLAQLGVGAIPEVARAVDVVRRDNCDADGALHLRRGSAGRSLALTGAVLWALGLLGIDDAGAWQPSWDWIADQLDTTAALTTPALVWIARASAIWGETDRLGGAEMLVYRLRAAGSQSLPGAFGFPLTHHPDWVTWMQALVELGHADMIPTTMVVDLAHRALPDGFWPLESVPGRLWFDPGPVGAANPWVTLRALAVLRATGWL